MAAFKGPVPLVPPPTPDSLVNKSALAGLTFSTESKKFRTFGRQFRSAIGTQYEYTMDAAIASGRLYPTDATTIAMHTKIYNMLILTFKDEDDVMDEMEAHCGKLGPACMSYLEDNYNSTSLAAAVNNLGAVVRETVIGPDQIAGLVARNKRFARLQLSEDAMVALILLKLPEKYATIKTMIIQTDKLPTAKVLINMLQTESDFSGGNNAPAAFSGIGVRPKFCYNCDTQGHINAECTIPKALCGDCGDKGHMTKHCWVRNDKPLPAWMTAEKKSSMMAKRVAYQAGKSSTSMSAIGSEMVEWRKHQEEDDTFLAMLERGVCLPSTN